MYKVLLLLVGFALVGAYSAYFIQSDIKIEEGSLQPDVYFYHMFIPYQQPVPAGATQLQKIDARQQSSSSQRVIREELIPTAIAGAILALLMGIYPALRLYRQQSFSRELIIALLILYTVLSLWLRIKMEKPYF